MELLQLIPRLACICLLVSSLAHCDVIGEAKDGQSIYQPPHIHLQNFDRKAAVFSENQHKLNARVLEQLSALRPQDILKAPGNVSKPCADSLQLLGLAMSDPSNIWATKMFDSWGKIGSGIFDGHSNFFGNYDECMNITGKYQVKVNSTKSVEADFTTNSCKVAVQLLYVINLQMGVCLPQQCTSSDITTLLKKLPLDKIPDVKITIGGTSCQNRDTSIEGGNLAALVVLSIMAGLCVLATLYEWVYQVLESWNSNSQQMVAHETSERTPLIATPKQSNTSSKPQGYFHKTVLAFSFYSNASKVLNTEQPAGALTALNGIRFLSMTWVILGHTIMMQMYVIDNPVIIQKWLKSFAFSVVLNATVSVDTFFILSGLLVSYLFLKDFHKRKIQVVGFFKALPMIYLHRYLRLTPAYAFMIVFWTCLTWFLIDGPYHGFAQVPPYKTLDPNCVDHWYLNILYVNNLFKVNDECAPWGWYLANDMQFFLIAPFIVFAFYLSTYIGLASCIATILGSVTAAIVVADQQRTPLFNVASDAKYDFTTPKPKPELPYYDEPWTRYQTYGIGLLAGFLIWKLKQRNYKIPTVLNLILWGVSAALCMSVIYGPYNAGVGKHVVSLAEAVTYNGISRTAWALGVSFVMISCSLGQGGWVNDFLSWKGFVPLSRLTYSAYLMHIPILIVTLLSKRKGFYHTDLSLALEVILMITISFMGAFVFTLIYEAPFINLDKIYLTPLSLKKVRDDKPTVEDAPPTYTPKDEAERTVNSV